MGAGKRPQPVSKTKNASVTSCVTTRAGDLLPSSEFLLLWEFLPYPGCSSIQEIDLQGMFWGRHVPSQHPAGDSPDQRAESSAVRACRVLVARERRAKVGTSGFRSRKS